MEVAEIRKEVTVPNQFGRMRKLTLILVGEPSCDPKTSYQLGTYFADEFIKLYEKGELLNAKKKGRKPKNSIFRRGVTGRDSDALLHRDTKTAKPTRARKGGHRMRGRLKLTVGETAEKRKEHGAGQKTDSAVKKCAVFETANTALDKEHLNH